MEHPPGTDQRCVGVIDQVHFTSYKMSNPPLLSNDQTGGQGMKANDVSDDDNAWRDVKEDPSRMRPRNMFDVTGMTYEQYCDKHYQLMLDRHREQMQMQMQMHQQMQMQQQQVNFGRR